MYPVPRPHLLSNTLAFEPLPEVKPTGFREYDARLFFGEELNFMGVQAVGLGLGTLIQRVGVTPEIVTGHTATSSSTRHSGAVTAMSWSRPSR